ncbi:MAG: carboxypeptidase regulatory-like domain-containing protein [Mucilaginibacter polytrichastri]|nr:carboxypeptidase regulatory-like domain-containing protein [Mucilaginibacter polytrichastri]
MNRARFYALILLISCASSLLYGQEKKMKPGELRGYVFDHLTRKPVEFCTVTVQAENDSTMVKYGMTGSDGEFIIKFLPKKTFRVTVAYIGLQKIERRIELTAERPGADLGKIYLLSENILLDEVKIVQIPPVVFKKDTVEYNAASFFTRPNASVEDLFKRLPGVQVDNEGNIKAFGEGIATVKVDGKVFFGNDPKIATKNLPADAIEKVQITQEKTEESKNKGIDDGKRVRVINLVLKEDHKTGWFGNTSLAQGTKDRYMGTAAVNHFNHDKQLNFLFSTNNINQIGYSEENAKAFNNDRIQYGNGYYSEDGSYGSEYGAVRVGNNQQGLTTTHSGGMNYGDSWGKKKKTEFNLSYFLYSDRKSEISAVNELRFQGTDNFNDIGNKDNLSKNQSHKANLLFKAEPDSLTSITFNSSFNRQSARTTYNYQSDLFNLASGQVNGTNGLNVYRTLSPQFSHTLNVSRSFKKQRGSMSLAALNSSYTSVYTNTEESKTSFFTESLPPVNINRQNQSSYTYRYWYIGNSYNFNVNKKRDLSISWDNSWTRNDNPNEVLSSTFNPLTGLYDLRVDSISNSQSNATTIYSSAIGLAKNGEKLSMSASSSIQYQILQGEINSRGITQTIRRTYLNMIPRFFTNYQVKPGKTLSAALYAYVSVPAAQYLFRDQNNSSPLYLRETSGELKATKNYNLSIDYSSYQANTKNLFRSSVSLRTAFDNISDSTTIDGTTGVTRVKMVNTRGESRLEGRAAYDYNAPLEGLQVSPEISYQTNNRINFLNGLKNTSRFYGPAFQLGITYNFKESLMFSASNRTGINTVKNSAQPERDNRYIALKTDGSINYEPVKRWWISADFTHVFIAGQRYMLANAGIQRNFMSKQQLSLELRAFDLFNQNANLVRSVYSNTITDTRSNNLNRYFFLRLNYRINKVGEQ